MKSCQESSSRTLMLASIIVSDWDVLCNMFECIIEIKPRIDSDVKVLLRSERRAKKVAAHQSIMLPAPGSSFIYSTSP